MAEGLPPCRLTSASILLSGDPRLSAGLYPLVWWGRSLGWMQTPSDENEKCQARPFGRTCKRSVQLKIEEEEGRGVRHITCVGATSFSSKNARRRVCICHQSFWTCFAPGTYAGVMPLARWYMTHSQKQKKIWNRVDCQRSEKRSETHKRFKRTLLIGKNKTKCVNFWGSPFFFSFFKAIYNMNITNQSVYLPFASLMLDVSLMSVLCPSPSASIPASSWQKISKLIFCLFLCCMCSSKKRTSWKFAHFVSFCPIKKRSF